MPTYTYRCNKCGEVYEVFQSMSDPPLKRCKKCRGPLRRILQPVGIVLKGPGFHKTDSRSKSASGRKDSSESSDRSDKKSEKSEPSKAESSKAESSKSDTKASNSDTSAKSDS